MKIAILTLGCRTNQAESLSLSEQLSQMGHEIVTVNDLPDYCIINTCTITHKADADARHLIKKLSQKFKTIVTGCFVKHNREFLNSLAIKSFENHEKSLIINEFTPNISQNTKVLPLAKQRPLVKIQDGCNLFCSYCIVPYVRGRSKSEPPEEILKKVQHYEDLGYREIVLTGIHIGSYGVDFKTNYRLSDLVTLILSKTKSIRLRISSIEITEIDDKILDLLNHQRFCKHLHIPLQSGCDRILKLMKRPYITAYYEAKINEILNKYPLIAIGTDVIAGFPSETDSDFNASLNFIKKIPFAYLHCFTFSKRKLTEAYNFKEQVPEKIKKLRTKQLLQLAHAKKTAYLSKFINLPLEVIIEQQDDKYLYGTSSNYIKVFVDKKSHLDLTNVLTCLPTEVFSDKLYAKAV